VRFAICSGSVELSFAVVSEGVIIDSVAKRGQYLVRCDAEEGANETALSSAWLILVRQSTRYKASSLPLISSISKFIITRHILVDESPLSKVRLRARSRGVVLLYNQMASPIEP
jgi:hypothetical protein